MFAIDEIAQVSPAKKWPPLGKFFLAISLLVASLLATTIIVPLIILIIGSSLLFYSTSFKLPKVVLHAVLDGIGIIAISAVLIALVTQGGQAWTIPVGPWALSFSDAGVSLGALIFFRAMAGIAVMLFFATSTPIPHFAYAMRQLRIPKEIAELVILVYRYSFLVLEQSETMHIAASCRLGFRGTKNRVRTTSKLAVGLFIRSMDLAERSQIALACRDFKGDFPIYRPPSKLSLVWTAVPFAMFISLLLTNAYITGRPVW